MSGGTCAWLVLGLLLAACVRAPSLIGRYEKVMEDSGETSTLVISSGRLELQGQVIAVTADGDALVHTYSCSAGPDDRTVSGKARVTLTDAGVDYVLVTPPDTGPAWDCNGDFDTVFGSYRRQVR